MVKEIYGRLTDGGRGGQIAYTLVQDKNQKVMEDWVLNLQPQAFGPLLLALSSSPKAFSIKEESGNKSYTKEDAYLLQQQAIARCIAWISMKLDASNQFEETLICMNRDGVRSTEAGINYCKNKFRLDSFMSERVQGLIGSNNTMRSRYHQRVAKLGARLNGRCEFRKTFSGPAFAPIEETKITYKGPSID